MRSCWKPKYISPFLLRQFFTILRMPVNKRPVLRVFSRGSVILPDFLGVKVMVHNGVRFSTFVINKLMVGHKFGEFAFTKRMGIGIHKPLKSAAGKSIKKPIKGKATKKKS